MKKYKLTTQDLRTRNTQWVIREYQPELSGEGELCGSGWYHYYHDPLLAVMFNPAHADIENPRCFEVEAQGKHLDDNGIKGGCTKMRLMLEIDLPAVTTTQRIAFGVLCAKEVYKNRVWNEWADNWLNGKDRSAHAAYAATYAADAAAYAAAYAAEHAAYAAAYAAYAADAAAYAAAYTADAGKWNYTKLRAIAKKAMEIL